MNLSVRLLRWLHPRQEVQRMEFRHILSNIEACAEDMTRTLRVKKPLDINQLTQPNKKNGGEP